jgi:hypothetical protein
LKSLLPKKQVAVVSVKNLVPVVVLVDSVVEAERLVLVDSVEAVAVAAALMEVAVVAAVPTGAVAENAVDLTEVEAEIVLLVQVEIDRVQLVTAIDHALQVVIVPARLEVKRKKVDLVEKESFNSRWK